MMVARVRGEGNLLVGKRGGQPAVKEPAGQEISKPRPTFPGNMDAIACGVEAWFEENTGYSRKVTETTVAIARALGMPEGNIKRWESARSIHDTEKGRVVQSLLARLQGSFPCADSGEY